MDELLGVTLGEFNADGSVKTDAPMCAVTGLRAAGNHQTRYRITGTPYFYRVLSDVDHLITDGWRAEFEGKVKGYNRGAVKRAPVVVEDKT